VLKLKDTELTLSNLCKRKIILGFLIVTGMLFSLEAQQTVTRQTALDAYLKDNYEVAYDQFSELLTLFPRDPLYKYYLGVCLVQMQKEPEKAIELFIDARRDDAVVRTVPADVLFWLGRAQQMAGRYSDAIASFNEFTEQAGRKAAREKGTPEYIQQCLNRKGELSDSDFIGQAKEKNDNSGVFPGKDPAVVEELEAEAARVSKTKPEAEQRVQPEAEPKPEPVQEAEDQTKLESKELPLYRPQEAEPLKANRDTLKELTMDMQDKSETPEITETKPLATKVDTTFEEIFDENIVEGLKQPAATGVLMLFDVETKLIHEHGEKIRINPVHPPGLIYRIQTAVFRNPVALSYFKGLTPVYGIRNPSTGLTAYYAGMFRKIEDAKKALPQVRQKGFRDAFIVAFSGGKPVSLERAAILEKEWGIIPFKPDKQALKEIQADTVPPTLSFRVEVVRSKKPVSEEDYEAMKIISGTRGLDVETLPDGSIVYLIGKFITFDSAENFAGLLVRNGYRDAKVVAWLGKREIPVETAKQLFNSLE